MLTTKQLNSIRNQVQFEKNVQYLGEFIYFDFLQFVDRLVNQKQ